MKVCILVRDGRHAFGGFETWVETVAGQLPRFGTPTITLAIKGDESPILLQARLPGTRVVPIVPVNDCIGQAKVVLEALESLSAQGLHGVFFGGGYPYVDVVSINLRGSAWSPLPVMHGRHPGAYDWVCLGPPVRAIAPACDLAKTLRQQMRSRIGYLRTLRRVLFIPHGIDLPAQAPRRVAGDSQAALKIAVVSRLNTDLKRPMDYIHVAQELKQLGVEFRMTIVGDGPARHDMEMLARKLELERHLKFTGALPRTLVDAVLRDAHVFVQTSESEAFGLAVAEALGNGCAVVASDVGGEVARMVNQSTGIRVPVGDISAFANALRELNGDRQHLADLGNAGAKWVRRHLTVDKMLRQYSCAVAAVGGKSPGSQDWRAPAALFCSPSEAVGPGLKQELKTRLRHVLGALTRSRTAK